MKKHLIMAALAFAFTLAINGLNTVNAQSVGEMLNEIESLRSANSASYEADQETVMDLAGLAETPGETDQISTLTNQLLSGAEVRATNSSLIISLAQQIQDMSNGGVDMSEIISNASNSLDIDQGLSTSINLLKSQVLDGAIQAATTTASFIWDSIDSGNWE